MCILSWPGHSESLSTQDAITLAHRLCLLLTKMTVSKHTLPAVKVKELGAQCTITLMNGLIQLCVCV